MVKKSELIDHLRNILEVDDIDILEELYSCYVESLESGLTELRVALVNEDIDKVKNSAHALKGCAQNAGHNSAAECAAALEAAAKGGNMAACRIASNNIDASFSIEE